MLRSYRNLVRQEPRTLSYSVLHTFFSSLGQTFFVALFIPILQQSHQLSHTEFGSLYGFATICSALVIPYLGSFVDRTHLRTYSLWVNSGLLLGYFLLTLTQSATTLFAALFLIRLCGQALLPHIAVTATGRYFEELRGRALAISGLGHPLGEATLPILLTFFISTWGWNSAIFLIMSFNILIFIPALFYLLPKDNAFFLPTLEDEQGSGSAPQSTMTLLKSPFFLLMLPALMSCPFIGTGFFFHQAAIATAKQWSLQWMIACFPIYAACRVLGSFSGGSMVDRWGARALAILPLCPLFIGICLANFETAYAIPAYMGCFGLAIGFSSCIYTAVWAECYGTHELGTVKSATKPFVIASTAIAPVVFGWFLDTSAGMQGVIFIGVAWVSLAFICLQTPVVKAKLSRSGL